METWKIIEDFPNYEVSDFGNVRNKRTKRVLKPREDKITNNYIRYTVNLYNDKGSLNQKIHRLVAEAFIPKIEGKEEVDHIDRNPANNALTNLHWVDRKENCENTGIRSDNTSGERNIYYSNQKKKWTIKKMIDGKEQSLGFYDTFEEAKKAKETGKYNFLTTNTGEKHISLQGNRFVFEKTHKGVKHSRSFKTLEEAKTYRDNILASLVE